MNDAISNQRLALVHPDLARRVNAAADELAGQGIYFRVSDGLRTYAEEDELFTHGRTAPGPVVTDAHGGYSNHNFGCAVDCYPFLTGSSGKLNWNAGGSAGVGACSLF
jgi:peptidoglycan L-alanyl-D-glutamate endopeptidase CwlK